MSAAHEVIERILPGAESEAAARREHPADWARYDFATQFVSGRRVIDCACGAGYGTRLLANAGAASVVGLDVSKEAIDWATAHFAAPNAKFLLAQPRRLPLDDASVDVAVSFETIEHVPEPDAPNFVAELARVLVPEGRLVLSTPLTRGPQRLRPPNQYHLREYDEDELARLLEPRFVLERRLGQHSAIAQNFAALKRSASLGFLVRAGLHRVVPQRVRVLLRSRLLGRRAPTAPDAWITADDWRDAPVQIVIARKRSS